MAFSDEAVELRQSVDLMSDRTSEVALPFRSLVLQSYSRACTNPIKIISVANLVMCMHI